MNIKTRLDKLEAKSEKVHDEALNVIIYRFADVGEASAEMNHVYSDCGTYHCYREHGEPENDFKERAAASIRKSQNKAPTDVLVLFGDNDKGMEANNVS